jgi:hypothetical protein
LLKLFSEQDTTRPILIILFVLFLPPVCIQILVGVKYRVSPFLCSKV